MHEIGIAASLIAAVREQTARSNGARVIRAGLRAGRMSGVNADSLSFAFQILVEENQLQPLELVIEESAADELELMYFDVEET